jgi:hypothetical protein
MDINTVWSAGLTVVIAVIGYFISDKFTKLDRIDILLNKTREEMARDYVTQSEIQRITDHIDQRFNKLEAKIEQLIQAGK